MALEFMVRHNQVIRPHPKGINHTLGLKVWEDIARRCEHDPDPTTAGLLLFTPRGRPRHSFLRRNLSEPLMCDLHSLNMKAERQPVSATYRMMKGGAP